MRASILSLLLLACMYRSYGQSVYSIISPEKDYPIQTLIEDYISYYNSLLEKHTVDPESEKFKSIFTPDAKVVLDFPPNLDKKVVGDSLRKGVILSVSKYVTQLEDATDHLYSLLPATGTNKIIRGLQGTTWQVWIENVCKYKGVGDTLSTSSILKLSFVKTAEGPYKIANISEVASIPADKDGDYIADDFDRCITPLKEPEHPVVTAYGCEVKSLYKKHPVSKFGLMIGGGVMAAVSSDIKEEDISAAALIVKPNYFNRTGISIDVSGLYTFSPYSALRVGFSFTRNSMNEAEMTTTINDYIGQYTSETSQRIRFHKTSKKLYTPYVGLSLGNFYNERSILSVEGILGYAIPTNSSNEFRYDIMDNNNGSVFSATSQFKAKAFPIYGGRFSYGISLDNAGLGRLVLSANYMMGKYNYKNSSGSVGAPDEIPNLIPLPSGNVVFFEGSTVHLWGMSLGLFYNISKPGVRKEQERYLELTNTK